MKKTQNKHTPGPWTATGHDGKQCVIIECDWGSVAKVLPIGAQDQETANARLIAAAPDLLEALEDAAFLMRMAAKIAGPMQDSFKRSAEDAAKAIAKAEGVK